MLSDFAGSVFDNVSVPDAPDQIAARGIDLEIIEKTRSVDQGMNVIVPNHVRINGVEVLVPRDSRIQISDISSDDCVTATITVFVGSLSIRAEVSDG